jgi:hypothetical protein
MITLGTIMFIGGLMLGIPALWAAGCILLLVGLVLGVMGATGHEVRGRQHWY